MKQHIFKLYSIHFGSSPRIGSIIRKHGSKYIILDTVPKDKVIEVMGVEYNKNTAESYVKTVVKNLNKLNGKKKRKKQ